MDGLLDIDYVMKQMIGQWQLDDGRLIEFLDQESLVLTTLGGKTISSTYFIYEDEDEIKLSIPILLVHNCTVEYIDEKEFKFMEHGVIGEVVLRRVG